MELIICLAVLGIILVGTQSAVLIAAKAIPDGRSPNSRIVAAANIMDTITSELAYATSFTTMNSNRVVFTVADRNGDNQPETIRYEWSGTPGTPLTRTYNDGAAVTLASKVQNFSLVYTKAAVAPSSTVIESGEVLLDSFTNTGSVDDYDIKSSHWLAQIFTPVLPANAVSWRVTRVLITARRQSATTGVTQMQLRPVVAGVPSTQVMLQSTLLESSLPSGYMWWEIPFLNSGPVGPSASLCLVLQWAGDNESCRVQYRKGLANGGNVMVQGSDSSSWSPTSNSLLYYVYGTVATPGPPVATHNLTSIRCTLQLAADARSRADATVQILNAPQVSGP